MRGSFRILLMVLAAGCSQPPEPTATADDPISLLSIEPADAFSRAVEPAGLSFPSDHGAHPDFQIEWWYFTGNLAGADGEFGFQLTLFRFALAPGNVENAWEARQIWVGQLAISDMAAERFLTAERISRQALDLAGAARDRLHVWLEDWRIETPGPGLETIRLRASDRQIALDLELSAEKPIVLNGDNGLSRKSARPGNASYYYSVPRLSARGELRIGNRVHAVAGSAWFDREWSTSALDEAQAGWDWFALQFEDGHDLMVYQLRNRDGSMHPFSAGTLTGPDGEVRHLAADEIEAEPVDHWHSPETGIRYPVRWRIAAADISAVVAARFPSQEHRRRFNYWEGAVAVEGRHGDRPVRGVGYLEMTGYQ